MSFVQLRQSQHKDIIQKRQRVSLVVNYAIESFIVFFKDKTFLHICRKTNKIIKQGSLNFLPIMNLSSEIQGRVIVMGYDDQNVLFCALLDVEDDYKIYFRQIYQKRPENTTKFHLIQNQPNRQELYIIVVMKNIQNGLGIYVYDFFKQIWSEEMIALNSRYLQYSFIPATICDKKYKQMDESDCHVFTLAALGQKFDSVNYAKIKISILHKDNHSTIALKFICMRQLKVRQKSFIVIGGYQHSQDELVLFGNTSFEDAETKRNHHGYAFTMINTHQVDINQPQQISLNTCKQGKNYPMLLRNFIGKVGNNLYFLVTVSDKDMGIIRMNKDIQQILINFRVNDCSCDFKISARMDCIYSIRSQLQQFFQKIKSSSSILSFKIFQIQDKRSQYIKMLRYKYKYLQQSLIDEAVSCL